MPEDIKYNCKDNDNHIICHIEENATNDDGSKDFGEMDIGDCLEESWTVISINDMIEALKHFNIKCFYDDPNKKDEIVLPHTIKIF